MGGGAMDVFVVCDAKHTDAVVTHVNSALAAASAANLNDGDLEHENATLSQTQMRVWPSIGVVYLHCTHLAVLGALEPGTRVEVGEGVTAQVTTSAPIVHLYVHVGSEVFPNLERLSQWVAHLSGDDARCIQFKLAKDRAAHTYEVRPGGLEGLAMILGAYTFADELLACDNGGGGDELQFEDNDARFFVEIGAHRLAAERAVERDMGGRATPPSPSSPAQTARSPAPVHDQEHVYFLRHFGSADVLAQLNDIISCK